MKKHLPQATTIVGRDGPPCPRCKNRTEVREHKHVGPKQLERPFYYSRWYCCANRSCKTNLIMPEEFKILNRPASSNPDDAPVLALNPGEDVVMDVLNVERESPNFVRGIDPDGVPVTIGRDFLGLARILWDDEAA